MELVSEHWPLRLSLVTILAGLGIFQAGACTVQQNCTGLAYAYQHRID
jgi:hypothetical protein